MGEHKIHDIFLGIKKQGVLSYRISPMCKKRDGSLILNSRYYLRYKKQGEFHTELVIPAKILLEVGNTKQEVEV